MTISYYVRGGELLCQLNCADCPKFGDMITFRPELSSTPDLERRFKVASVGSAEILITGSDEVKHCVAVVLEPVSAD